MGEQIGNESIFLQISELKKDNVQFTDSTNAARLIMKYGRDIWSNTNSCGHWHQRQGMEFTSNILVVYLIGVGYAGTKIGVYYFICYSEDISSNKARLADNNRFVNDF